MSQGSDVLAKLTAKTVAVRGSSMRSSFSIEPLEADSRLQAQGKARYITQDGSSQGREISMKMALN